MHTTETRWGRYTLRCFHNGDWSGEVHLLLLQDENLEAAKMMIEGDLLVRFALDVLRPAIHGALERFVEDFLDSEGRTRRGAPNVLALLLKGREP
jgi:hypothetical protein